MKNTKVAKSYAAAVFEVAIESATLEAISAEFSNFITTVNSSVPLQKTLFTRAFDVNDKLKVTAEISKTSGYSKVFSKLLEIMASKNRMECVNEVYDEFNKLVDHKNNVLKGTLIVADRMEDSVANDIANSFAKKLSKKVVLNQKVNKDIIGGLIVEIDGKTYDGSLKTQLNRIKETLER